MAGIDTITKEILEDASREADAIIKAAQKAADAEAGKAQADRDAILSEARSRATKDAEIYAGRVTSQCDRIRREAVLSAKQDMIREVMKKAYETLVSQSTEEYFSMLEKLLEKNVQASDGELFLNETDLRRLPKKFEKHAAEIAARHNGTVTVSGKAAAIANGFILRYGGIDENCTFEALFAEKKEVLEDKAHEVLW